MLDYLPQEIIARKRDGNALTAKELEAFVAGITSGDVVDAQIAAFTMAVFLNGMTPEEGATLTRAMTNSGRVIDWTRIGLEPGAPIVDKHSTGGVGDKVSLMLAPIVAACGAFVPMISGRGLGHTGGTLDKLESIPGYKTTPSIEAFETCVKMVGTAIIGQTSELAPADRRVYSVRDVTGTVESVPLITASILSKKLAAGLNGLVMDVKVGNGAFMQSMDNARKLSRSIVNVASAAGLKTTAIITDMNEVLGRTAGNAIEVLEAVEFLVSPDKADGQLLEITLVLAAEMLALGSIVKNRTEGYKMARECLFSGRAADKFAQMVHALDGPSDLMENPDRYLKLAPVRMEVLAPHDGYITAMQTRDIGMLIVAMGGGRTRPEDSVDHSVGIDHLVNRGCKVGKGDRLCTIYAKTEDMAEHCRDKLLSFIAVEDTPVEPPASVREIIEGDSNG
ncbi:thymidine phosphorylase [Kordiimonas sediminis]|uniref:Thymidine phosphorylase n=1 Tax=Kordiimonas sediminis TaxID=1735581 RepID=A0A919AXG0_9PROT|nr:thymidine phosphorylase [Kordiimonas sediminis]GHF30389.1 thymidine phosphorylase [Kordiimonas sediminis]